MSVQCMNTETKLELLRRRMAGMSVSVAELRRKELEYMSLVRIQVLVISSVLLQYDLSVS